MCRKIPARYSCYKFRSENYQQYQPHYRLTPTVCIQRIKGQIQRNSYHLNPPLYTIIVYDILIQHGNNRHQDKYNTAFMLYNYPH